MDDDPKCCGRISPAWADGPLRPGCAACPTSPTYWRLQADGTVRADRSAAESYEGVGWGGVSSTAQ